MAQSQTVMAAFEWAGSFPMNDASHTWSLQAVGGEYADPSIRLVFYVTEAGLEGIETNEDEATALIDGDCTVVEAGGTLGPFDATTGSCYELRVGSEPDSFYSMQTDAISALTIFAQHFPTEFERDQHYLKDSAGTDIEPVAQEGGDGHDHHHHGDDEAKEPCACVAASLGFNIDCTATAAMTDSLNFLKSGGCATECDSDACQKAWYVVQTHHDYCKTDELPTEVEDDFHDFDEVCNSCAIARILDEDQPDCPAATCDDESGNEAYAFLVDNGCLDDCSVQACSDAYITLRVVHDSCDHDVLSAASEEGLHDFEEVCDVGCNVPASYEDQLTCPASGSAGLSAAMAFGAIFWGAALLLF